MHSTRVMEFDFGIRTPEPSSTVTGPSEHIFDFGRTALGRVLARCPDPR